MAQKRILTFNDLHIGSCYGLLPEDFRDSSGNIHQQNLGQKFLWGLWKKTLNRLAPQTIDYIVVNGDLLDGKQPKNKGIPLTLHRVEDQREAAVKVLEEVRNTFPKAKWFFIEGTPYHEVGHEVGQVAQILLGEKHTPLRTLTARVGKATLRFHHETSFAGGPGKAGSLERELITGWQAEAADNWPAIHCEVRAHCHYFSYVGRKDRLAIVLPGWQLQTDYTTKGSPTKNIPDLGCAVLSVDDSLMNDGRCPVSFTPYLYKHPGPEITDLGATEYETSAETVTL